MSRAALAYTKSKSIEKIGIRDLIRNLAEDFLELAELAFESMLYSTYLAFNIPNPHLNSRLDREEVIDYQYEMADRREEGWDSEDSWSRN